ncbi:flagellin [Comamonas jiangduensis]|uniref:flagellin n=1 Tax=Comamonas jiangduensis TaxID=1194168 RepID=UPI003BF89089
MAMVINTNISSLNAQRQLAGSANKLGTAMERLSSGLRINSAKDDAAGLAISSRMTTQITGLNVAQRNANDGISLAQTAEGALSTIENNLQRIRELSVQSANATNSATDRAALQKEVTQLTEEIDRVAKNTEFNGTKLLDGSFTSKSFQVGANAGQTISIDSILNAQTGSLGQYQGFADQELTNTAFAAGGTASTIVFAPQGGMSGTAETIDLGTVKTDGKEIAAAINAANVKGLTATVDANEVAGQSMTTPGTTTAETVSVAINGVSISINAVANVQTRQENTLSAINAQSAVTGVTAVKDGDKVKLVAADGRNISVGAVAGTNYNSNAHFGLVADNTAAPAQAKVKINYAAQEGDTRTLQVTGAATLAAKAPAAAGQQLAKVDISTVKGANEAMNTVDAALTAIASGRAGLGAIQNRFESVVSNLAVNAENLTASRSRILDADFAVETANLSSAQVLQQAGTAMVAQANQLPQNVLSLLR